MRITKRTILSAAAILLLGIQTAFADPLTYGQQLGQVIPAIGEAGGIAGTWSWLEPETFPEAGTAAYPAVFTPVDTANYESLTTEITVTTRPATPMVTNASASLKSGSRLSSITSFNYTATGVGREPLTGEFTLAELDHAVSRSGSYSFTFQPDNPNYTSAAVQVMVTVTGRTSTGGGGGGYIGRPAAISHTVTYAVGSQGTILAGNTTETVKDGQTPSQTPVVKVDTDTIFLGWSLDGITTVQPGAIPIHEDTTFTALYQEAAAEHAAYIQGYGDGTFRPDMYITRAETAAILSRVAEQPEEIRDLASAFIDLQTNAWYFPAVNTVLNLGLMQGYGDNVFRPDAVITRAEFVAAAARYLSLPIGLQSSFDDCIGHWADGYIGAAADRGIIQGYEDASFRPEQPITRAEAVQVINGLLGRATICGFEAQNPFTDLTTAHWAYGQILEAAQVHTCQSIESILRESLAD